MFSLGNKTFRNRLRHRQFKDVRVKVSVIQLPEWLQDGFCSSEHLGEEEQRVTGQGHRVHIR